jgi:hypothetical protein
MCWSGKSRFDLLLGFWPGGGALAYTVLPKHHSQAALLDEGTGEVENLEEDG